MAAKTQIQNTSSGPIGLPFPLRGVLMPGARVVLNADPAVVLAAFGGQALRGALEISRRESTAADDGGFWLGSLNATLAPTQTAWAIDPINGDDGGPGTTAAPLRTMAEFNRRMQGAVVSVAATLQLVGDVLDAPLWLRGVAFAAGASLTVSGTVTTIATTATITVVTGLNPSSATVQPWQLTTAGIDWTTVPVGSRLDLSNGTVAFVRAVVDANNVITGAHAAFTGSTSITPTAGLTIVVRALSRALPSLVDISATGQSVVVTVRDLSIDAAAAGISVRSPYQQNVVFFGCEIKTAAGSGLSGTIISSDGGLLIRSCRFTMPAGSPAVNYRSGLGQLNCQSCVWSGATTGFVSPNAVGQVAFTHACIQNAQLQVQAGASLNLFSSCNIQHTTLALFVDSAGQCAASCVVTGTSGISIGIRVRWGAFTWAGAANKPTLSGATADCEVAGVQYTYAALGLGKAAVLLDAIPPTVQPTISGNAGAGPGIAVMSQTI